MLDKGSIVSTEDVQYDRIQQLAFATVYLMQMYCLLNG
jgi:hypothetical protein